MGRKMQNGLIPTQTSPNLVSQNFEQARVGMCDIPADDSI